MGRKKREIPTRTVKLDGDLVSKAEWLARDQGINVAQFLSDVLRPHVDREWLKAWREKTGEAGPKGESK